MRDRQGTYFTGTICSQSSRSSPTEVSVLCGLSKLVTAHLTRAGTNYTKGLDCIYVAFSTSHKIELLVYQTEMYTQRHCTDAQQTTI